MALEETGHVATQRVQDMAHSYAPELASTVPIELFFNDLTDATARIAHVRQHGLQEECVSGSSCCF